jgi:hypothetical protein
MRGSNSRLRNTVQFDLRGACKAEILLVWIVRSTSVAVVPSLMTLGEKMAVEPAGIPLALRVMAVANVGAPVGETTKPYVAVPPV